ncbi:hypothetical protein K8S19_09570 [bacterium]|nr:hypothetical protein [bacterium]
MRWFTGLLLLAMVFGARVVQADDYAFEIPVADEMKVNEIQLSGNLEAKWALVSIRQESPFYWLYMADAVADVNELSQYQLDFYFNGDYQHKNIGLHVKMLGSYINEDQATGTLLEAFNHIGFFSGVAIELGKRRYNWGKGYAFNPGGYINSIKDPEDPQRIQEGLLSFNLEYVKCFDSDLLPTLAFNFVALPPEAEMLDKYGDWKKTRLAGKLYLLVLNTDLDFMALYDTEDSHQIGMDFSRSIANSWEVHGEVSCFNSKEKKVVEHGSIQSQGVNGWNYLAGIQWQPVSTFKFIIEYYHQDTGLTEDEFGAYLHLVQNLVSSGMPAGTGLALNSLASNNLMQDYIYATILHQELLGILYLSHTPIGIINLHDGSFTYIHEIAYSPYTNLTLYLIGTCFSGVESSEYGSKQIMSQFELGTRIYF